MDSECTFCQLVSGKLPSKKIYEDDSVVEILDIYPANPAHVLVLPKEHQTIFTQLSREVTEHLGVVAKRTVNLLLNVIKPDGVNVFIANGPAAGQKAPHFIMHIIPRFQGDGLNFELAEKEAKTEEIDVLYEKLRKIISNYFPEQKL